MSSLKLRIQAQRQKLAAAKRRMGGDRLTTPRMKFGYGATPMSARPHGNRSQLMLRSGATSTRSARRNHSSSSLLGEGYKAGGEVGDPDIESSASVPKLQFELDTSKSELLAAKKELSYTAELLEVLRGDLMRSDQAIAERDAKLQEAFQTKLKADAEIDALHQQVETKHTMYVELRDKIGALQVQLDKQQASNREALLQQERQHVQHLAEIRRQHAAISGSQDQLSQAHELNEGLENRIRRLQAELDSKTQNVVSFEQKMQLAGEDKAELQDRVKKLEKNVQDLEIVLNQKNMSIAELERSVANTRGLLQTGNTDAMRKAHQDQERVKSLVASLAKVKQELAASLTRNTQSSTRIAELESRIRQDELQKIRNPSSDHDAKLRQKNAALGAQIDMLQEQLDSRERQMDELKLQLDQAESQVESRRHSIARRDSIAARQAASLSIQLARAEGQGQSLKDELADTKERLLAVTSQLEKAKLSLAKQQSTSNSKKGEQERVAASLATAEAQLKALREQLTTKDMTISRQNQQMAQMDSDLSISIANQDRERLNSDKKLAQAAGELSASHSQITSLRAQLRDSAQALKRAQSDIDSLKQQLRKETNAAERLLSEVQSERSHSHQLQSEVSELRIQVTNLSQDLEAVSDQLRSSDTSTLMEQKRNDTLVANLRQRVSDLELQKADLEGKLAAQTAEVDRQRAEVIHAREQLRLSKFEVATVDTHSASAATLPASASHQRTRSAVDTLSSLRRAEERRTNLQATHKDVETISLSSSDPWLVVSVDIGQGVTKDIEVHYGEDARAIATDFVSANNLPPATIEKLTSYLQEHIDDEERERTVAA